MSTGDKFTLEELIVHARAMESEASDRYEELADAMDVHNNPEVAALFRRMAEIEGKHSEQVGSLGEGLDLPDLKAWEYSWGSLESPETPAIDATHYMMQPYHAIKVAIRYEQRAVRFFEAVCEQAPANSDLHTLATEMAEDEREHVRLLNGWLERYPEPEDGWDDDMDPPTLQE
jgi:rubrerythrin